jgi:cellulose synthase operon protein C
MNRGRALLSLLALVPLPALASAREDARAALEDGVAHFYAGDARAARIELLNATKADPQWGLAQAVSARNFLALGDGVAAEAAIARAISEGVPEASLQHLALNAWLLQGQADRVLAQPLDNKLLPVSRGFALRVRGRAAMALGDYEGAAKEFDAALKFAPNSSLLWSDIGRFRMQGGNIAGAVDAAARAVALNQRNVEALMLTGELARGQFGLMAAIPWFERVLDIDRGNIEAMLQMAATLGDAGHARAMLAMTRKVLAADPDNAQAWYLQAVLAARAYKPELARSLLYRTGGRLDGLPGVMLLKAVLAMQENNSEQAIAQLEDLVAVQPDNLRARRLLGTAMWRAGDARSAIAVLGRMAQRPDADSYTLSVIGRAYEDAGDRASAARYLERASLPMKGEPVPFEMAGDLARMAAAQVGNPDDANVAVPRIAAIISSGQASEGLAQAQQLQARNPGAPAAHMLVGDALMALNRPQDAAVAYARAANIRFSEPVALRFIAALKASGQGAGALRVLDLFLSQNPRSVAGLLLASDHLMATAQWDAAIGVLEGLRVRLGNSDATILNNLGWAWFSKGNATKAVEFSSAAYAIAPANPAVVNSYGWILFKTGQDKPGGLALLAKAVAIAPGHPGLRYQLAQALTATGRKADAIPHLRAALAVSDFPDRKAAADLLAANGG